CAEKDAETETGVREETHVAAVVCSDEAGYEKAKARLQALVHDFDVDPDTELETPATEHDSFIPGRVADIVIDCENVGVIGEIHPEVLAKKEVVMPAAAFEFDISALK
ncbi:MAG: phenylalanine--tRNA ligase subunit beta, partial [Halobacteria archaeon]|nr:phenylalanine--tRNA ligase subunit beta [Halobacteria archaeon]